MDLKQSEKILQALPVTGIFIIREDNHAILSYNQRGPEVPPHVRTGMACQELGDHSCANCPLLTIGDRQTHQTICYNSPFGEIVDIRAVRTLWKDEIPAFIITVSPHVQAVSQTYHKIMRVNLAEVMTRTVFPAGWDSLSTTDIFTQTI